MAKDETYSSFALRFSPSHRPAWMGLLITVLAALLTGALIFQTILRYHDLPFDWDEAVHANGGLILALDLRAGDLPAFFRDSYAQAYYPPAFSWLLAPMFLIFGPSRVAARATSLICLLLAVAAIYLVGLTLDKRRGWVAGLIAALLTLFSLPLLTNAALVMLETPALLTSSLALLIYIKALDDGPRTNQFCLLASVLLGFTFLVKYPYGLALALTLVIAEALRVVRRSPLALRRPLPLMRWASLFGPLFALIVLWLAGPGKIAGFIAYTRQQIPQDWTLSLADLLFYPQAIALSYSPTPWVAGLLLAGLVSALTHAREERLRLLIIYFVVGIGLLLLEGQHHSIRFAIPFVPALYLVAGRECGRYLGWRPGPLDQEKPSYQPILVPVLTLITLAAVLFGMNAVFNRLRLYPALMRVEYETDPESARLAAWLAAVIPQDERRVVLVNPWDQFSGPALEWAFLALQPNPLAHFHDQQVGVLWPQSSSIETVQATKAEWDAQGVRYVVVFEGSPEGCGVCWPGYYELLQPQLALVAETSLVLHT